MARVVEDVPALDDRIVIEFPAELPPIPERKPRRWWWSWAAPAGVAVVAAAPMLLMLISVMAGGGPRTESADDALITMATRDAIHGHQLLGPYSRFGWHHPGPTYFYVLSLPTWIAHGGPTGSWVGATAIGAAAVLGAAIVVRRVGGPRAGWWFAVGAVAVVCGLGPGLLRDPWNPYVVTLPVLFVAMASAAAAAGARGALAWALVVGSLAVQTHVSTAPVVVGLIGAAAVVQFVRWCWRRAHPAPPQVGHVPLDPIPGILPALDLPDLVRPWWTYRPDIAIAVMVLVLEWTPPLWDQFWGSGNLGKLLSFFAASHPTHPWGLSWHLVTAVAGIAMFQHHGAVQDTVADPHPLVTTVAFVLPAIGAIALGIGRKRPFALWCGAFGLLAGLLAVLSVTRIVGQPFRYLIIWMAVLPVLPLVGLASGLEGLWSDWASDAPPTSWLRAPGAVLTAAAVIAVSVLGLVDSANATPAAALTDPRIVAAWNLVAPVVGTGHEPVRIELADGSRWPAAAGVALELERHGHPVRVEQPWTLLFGTRRLATGSEPIALIFASVDTTGWPPPDEATLLGQEGPSVIFVRRQGPACWLGWMPMGGPACPAPAQPAGPLTTR